MRSSLLAAALCALLPLSAAAKAPVKGKAAEPARKPKVPHAVLTLKRLGPSKFQLESPRGTKVILDTVAASTATVADQRKGDIRIRTFEDGQNTIFLYETAGLRIVHLGALDHLLSKEQMATIGNVDIVLVPVRDDAVRAHAVVGQLQPKYLIVPMHYSDSSAFRTAEDPVTKNVEDVAGDSYTLDPAHLPKDTKIIFLGLK